MKEKFLRYISEKKLCTVKDKILLTVSGGIDSMVMLHLFHKNGFNIAVAHVNFQLRGSESDGDEQLVKKICAQFSIPFFSKQVDTRSYALQHSLSTQMAARELRYAWFNELTHQHHFDFVATAHHVNDSIETVLLNFVRGSGMEGYDGIAVKNKNIIRPLLFAMRNEIEIYAQQNKIEWREDSSNASDDYSRNFIRHNVVPLLKEINPSLENSFQDAVEKILGASELGNLGLRTWEEKFKTEKENVIFFSKKGFENFENTAGLLWNLVKQYGFNIDQCKNIINALSGQSGKRFSSTDFELIVDREHLIISKHENELSEVLIEKNQLEAHLGKSILKITSLDKVELSDNNSIALLDADKIQFPLKWRKWKSGDYFFPLGMNHKKKLSDFFIDQKISVAEKETITVLESANEIVWVVGYRIDERFKILGTTKRVIQFSLHT